MVETAEQETESGSDPIFRSKAILELVRRDGSGRPVEKVVCGLARQKLAEADDILRQVDEHWSPPPYDPFLVAQALGIRCQAVDAPWVEDAMIFVQDGEPTILYRPERSSVRTRFNIFHEIAHTLFPDYLYNDFYRSTSRPRLFEPEGQLEYLCDTAAAEFLMPMDLFQTDLRKKGFGAEKVQALCARYGASMEAVCLRMVEANVESCCLGLLEQRREDRNRRRGCMRVVYATPTERFRQRRLFFPPFLELGSRSCILLAARSKKMAAGEEEIDLGRGQRQQFRIEALPLTARRRRHGRAPVLAFFYPL